MGRIKSETAKEYRLSTPGGTSQTHPQAGQGGLAVNSGVFPADALSHLRHRVVLVVAINGDLAVGLLADVFLQEVKRWLDDVLVAKKGSVWRMSPCGAKSR
jgi:hypothetical protein